MNITSAIILFAVIWFMVLFIVLPLRLKTQGDTGEVVPGTSPSAPSNFDFKRKAKLVTIIAAVAWVVITSVVLSGVITLRDIDVMHRLDSLENDEIGG